MKTNKKLWIFFLFLIFLAGIVAIFSLSSSPQQNIPHNTLENMVGVVNSVDIPGNTNANNLGNVNNLINANNLVNVNANISCPDILFKQGNILLLYNSKIPIGNGTNPIPFASLDDYTFYLQNQRSKGILCPTLFLQQEYDTQGNAVYRMRPSPYNLQGGLPSQPPVMQQNNMMILPTNPNDANSVAMNQYYSGVNLTGTVSNQSGPKKVVNVVDASRENGYNQNEYPGFDPYGQYVGVYTNLDVIHDSTAKSSNSDNPMDPNWGGIDYTNQSINSGKYNDNSISKPLLYQPRGQFMPNMPGALPPPQDILN